MVMEQEIIMEHSHKHIHCMRRPSWTAIFVGALVGVGIAFILNLFSVAIGLSALKTNAGINTIAVGGFIGIAIATVVSTFVGGWTAGFLGKHFSLKNNLGVLYGFTSWCVALVITILLAFPTMKYVSIYSRFISNPTAMSWQPGMYHMQQQTMNTTPDTSANQASGMSAPNINTLAVGTFLIFVLFFLGALSSCFGGHFGMCHRCKHLSSDVDSI